MKKLTLNLEQLSVETFQAGPAVQERGTVQAREAYSDRNSCWDTECGYATYCMTTPCACI